MLQKTCGRAPVSYASAIADESYKIVRISVDARRPDRGCKAAIAEFARHVGLNERRVHAIYCGQVSRLWADELLLLRERARQWMAADLARQEAKIAALRAELDAMEGVG